MRRWLQYLGIAGVVIFLFGIVGSMFVGFGNPIMKLHLGLGAVLIIISLISSGIKITDLRPSVLRSRGMRLGANFAVYSAIFIGILICINWLASRERFMYRWDLTAYGVYSLSPKTQEVLKQLEHPLHMVFFDTGAISQNSKAFKRLKLYDYYSPKVTLDIVKPNKSPHLVQKYKMSAGNVLYLGYGPKDKPLGESRLNNITETEVTKAIIKLSKGGVRKIYYLVGHGEPPLSDMRNPMGMGALKRAVEDDNMQIDELNLSLKGQIPDDADAIIIASPKKKFFPSEVNIILKWLANGGGVLLMNDPIYPPIPDDIDKIANEYGIVFDHNVVLDKVMRLFAGPTMAIQFKAASKGYHNITDRLSTDLLPIFNLAMSVDISTDKKREKGTYSKLFFTSPNAWGETDLKTIFSSDTPRVALDQGEKQGELALAIAYELNDASYEDDGKNKSNTKNEQNKEENTKDNSKDRAKKLRTTRIVVFGDSDWARNAFLGLSGNRDVLLNSLNWLAGETANITIRTPVFKSSLIDIPDSAFLIILATGFFIPEFILLLGLLVWWQRRTA